MSRLRSAQLSALLTCFVDPISHTERGGSDWNDECPIQCVVSSALKILRVDGLDGPNLLIVRRVCRSFYALLHRIYNQCTFTMPIPTNPRASLNKKSQLLQAARFHGLAGSSGGEAVASLHEALNTAGGDGLFAGVGDKSCSRCGVVSSETLRMLTCGACGKATYCGKECQRAAWPGHKGLCKDVANSKSINGGPMERMGVDGGQVLKKWFKNNRGLAGQAASQELLMKGLSNTHGLVMQLEVVDDKVRVNEVYTKELAEIDKLLARDHPAPKPAGHMLVAFFTTVCKGNAIGITKMTYTYSGGSHLSIPMPELITRMNT